MYFQAKHRHHRLQITSKSVRNVWQTFEFLTITSSDRSDRSTSELPLSDFANVKYSLKYIHILTMPDHPQITLNCRIKFVIIQKIFILYLTDLVGKLFLKTPLISRLGNSAWWSMLLREYENQDIAHELLTGRRWRNGTRRYETRFTWTMNEDRFQCDVSTLKLRHVLACDVTGKQIIIKQPKHSPKIFATLIPWIGCF